MESLHYKIAVLGKSAVGKTSIISRFIQDTFPTQYKETVEDFHKLELSSSDRAFSSRMTVEILEHSGSFEFPVMRKFAMKRSDAFILVFSVDDPGSVETIWTLRDEIKDVKGCDNMPIVLVANKTDISQKPYTCTWEKICRNCKYSYIEASAKECMNIEEIFEDIFRQGNIHFPIREVLSKRRNNSVKSNKSFKARKNEKRKTDKKPFNPCCVS